MNGEDFFSTETPHVTFSICKRLAYPKKRNEINLNS